MRLQWFCAVACAVLIPGVSTASAQDPIWLGPPKCVEGCGTPRRPAPKPERKEPKQPQPAAPSVRRAVTDAVQEREQAIVLNARGNTAYWEHRWSDAIALYKQALARLPGDSVIKENLHYAELQLELAGVTALRGSTGLEFGDARPAEGSSSLEFGAGTDAVSQSLLDFQGRSEPSTPKNVLPCSTLERRLAADRQALVREQQSIAAGNGELAAWTERNRSAQQHALQMSVNLLVDGATSALRALAESKLSAVEHEFLKRAPAGETWRAKIRNVQDLRLQRARLSGVVDGLKLVEWPGGPAQDAWVDLWNHATESDRSISAIDYILASWNRDPQIRQILHEAELAELSGGLKPLLKPWLGDTLTFTEFAVDYFYDGVEYAKSGARILQQTTLRSSDLEATKKLKGEMESTARQLRTCR